LLDQKPSFHATALRLASSIGSITKRDSNRFDAQRQQRTWFRVLGGLSVARNKESIQFSENIFAEMNSTERLKARP